MRCYPAIPPESAAAAGTLGWFKRIFQVGSGDWPFETRAGYDMDTFTRIV